MKYIITIFALLICNYSLAEGAKFSKTEDLPSETLLKIVNVSNLEISNTVLIVKNECVIPETFQVKAKAHLENVKMIKTAIETVDHKKQKLLASLINDGGLVKKNPTFNATVNIKEFNLQPSNVWVFYFLDDKVYANAINVLCKVIYESSFDE